MRIAVVVLLSLLSSLPALAEKRVALLIGNETYTSDIGRLSNPHNDIALVEKALKGLGFEVSAVSNAGLGALHQAVNGYARQVRAAGPGAVGFFYYAGHGAADEGGTNYLIPVDATSAEEGVLWDQSLRLTEITRKLKVEAGNATHFVVFDACRNTLRLRKSGSRAVVQSRGFVPVAQESGMLIAYATAQGELASDVGDGAGPYSSVLAEEIVKPGVEAVTMFRNVQRRVRAAIKQEPYLGFDALGDVYLAGLTPELSKAVISPAPTTPTTSTMRLSEAGEAWTVTKDATSIPALEAFIRRFGDTYYGDLAKVRLAGLRLAEDRKEERRPGRVFRDCLDVCPEMVVLSSGAFMMGSTPAEIAALAKELGSDWYKSEGPQRKVTIAWPFAVGKYEVTFAEWDACVADSGCKHQPSDQGWGRGRRPAINVSWHDAKEYVHWLSGKTGKSYRLLSEAEWEYAARAGTPTRDTFGGKGQARHAADRTAEVGSFPANRLGLHDMHGNVWEWVEDNWHLNYQGAPADESVWQGGDASRRPLRGGGWNSFLLDHRSAVRIWDPPEFRDLNIGFRVARTL